MGSAASDQRVTDVLKRARARIADPERWTELKEAADAAGEYVWPHAPQAVRWCAAGALARECAARVPYEGAAVRLDRDLFIAASLRLATGLIAQPSTVEASEAIVRVNDNQGHEAILALFDEAIRQK